MMKKRIILVAICVLMLVTMLAACAPKGTTINVTDFSKNWMNYIDDSAKITKIAIPGSHDSGTIGMNSMYCTQNSKIGDQLKLGVRYFDIRVHKEDDKLVIFHSSSKGVDFYPILDDIKAFLQSYKSEFLVLDFQHFSGGSQEAVKKALTDKGIIDIAIKNTTEQADLEFVDSLTLGEVRGKVIIMWGSGEEEDYLFRRNNDACSLEGASLDSMYVTELNQLSSENFIKEALPKYFDHIIKKGKGLTVLQGQLTASVANFVNISAFEERHNKNMTQYVYDIANNKQYLDNVNIIMRDFIEADPEKVSSILSLNLHKKLVKSDMIDDFTASVNLTQLG